MKKIKIISAFTMLFLLTGNTIFSQSNQDKKGFALLELYTSEGCSSCPPADELMGKIQKEYKEDNVYVLSYHVDYWDKQGWKDIFSSASNTKRQYDYAKFLGKEPIYTPQLIINGKIDYIGSQETAVQNGIRTALSKPVNAEITLEASIEENKLNVNYSLSKVPKNNRLFIAVVQKSGKINVKRGENANRVLSHFQIVRSLNSFALTENSKGTASLALPKDFNTKDFEVIGFVQDMNSGIILTAERAVFAQNLL
ncbi:DUF1223 domain-containing protein [Flavobacterium sp. LC2016-01]|uniref:DUF1223 domain-containing protein n=1 Tax=Flavobacterium sp. LC2016-01 TaxID=2675876 RepID=UPI0012BADE24|nr:DUF1223 domain-containing protein [Flavobacterium sp. LC2016-01]MTH14785.1 DUF1223 domain-containing protein [Flavobacterium sp. LC2016-01]